MLLKGHMSHRRCLFFASLLTFASELSEGHCNKNSGVSSHSPVSTAAMASISINRNLHHSLRFLLTSMSVTLCLKLPAESKASDLCLGSTSAPVSVFSPGYKIELQQYQNLLDKMYPCVKPSLLAASDNADSTIESLKHDAQDVLNEARKLSAASNHARDKISPIILMGHSRGGAVAALAAAIFLESMIGDENRNLNVNFLPTNLLLVLLDPVDSPELAVMKTLQKSMSRACSYAIGGSTSSRFFQDSDRLRNESLSAWPFPVLIISTPYGGSSAYYKVPYESTCAPTIRSGDAFFKIFRSSEMQSGESVEPTFTPTRAAMNIKGNSRNILQVRLIDVGHTQLLASRKTSPFGSICSYNDKVSDEDVRGFISMLSKEWIRISLNPETDTGKDFHTKVVDLKRSLSTMYPAMRTEWSS